MRVKWSFLFIGFFFAILVFSGCANEKEERRMIGDWKITSYTVWQNLSTQVMIKQGTNLGTMSLGKSKADFGLNIGNWKFESFPDSILPPSGDLLWTSGDKDDSHKAPWSADFKFTRSFQKDTPVVGAVVWLGPTGTFSVTEIKKRSKYKLKGLIVIDEFHSYTWEFEMEEN